MTAIRGLTSWLSSVIAFVGDRIKYPGSLWAERPRGVEQRHFESRRA